MSDRPVSWAAVWRGSVLGLAIVVPLAIVLAFVERVLDRSSLRTGIESVIVVLLFAGYFTAGFRAGRTEPSAPLTNGILAAVGTLVVWIPVYVLIVLARGDDLNLRAGTVFAQALVAAFLGMLGGWLASRHARAAPDAPDAPEAPDGPLTPG